MVSGFRVLALLLAVSVGFALASIAKQLFERDRVYLGRGAEISLAIACSTIAALASFAIPLPGCVSVIVALGASIAGGCIGIYLARGGMFN